MAEGKTSFVLYCDWIHTLKYLTMEQRGIVITWVFEYVNDMNPKPLDGLLMAVIEPIRQQLKRDLKKWDVYIEKQRINGAKGGRPKKTQKTQPLFEKPKKPDNVNVNVSVNDILLEKEIKEVLMDWLNYRKQIKKPIKSEMTIKQLAKKMESEGLSRSRRVVDISITNGWQGLFWDKINEEKVNAGILLKREYGIND